KRLGFINIIVFYYIYMRSHLLSLVSSIERSCPDIFRLTYENKKALTTSIDLSFLLPLFKNNKKGSSS
ncbi:hypothetical protein OK414_12430, partial [Priestia sp. JV24]|uniref:hypothetical protein n=1 Tax=Priestia TaxID=2800373 RepID=UPI0021D65114